MNSLACESEITYQNFRTNANPRWQPVPMCSTGWQVVDTSVVGGGIDYVVSGQYFTAAFVVSASIILSTVVLRTLLNFIRR